MNHKFRAVAKEAVLNDYFFRIIKCCNPIVNYLRRLIGIYDKIIYYRSLNTLESGAMACGVAAPHDVKPIINYYKQLKYRVDQFDYQPTISIIIPIYKVNEAYLKQTLQSVVVQTYQNWEICAVDDGSKDKRISACLSEYEAKFPGKFKTAEHQINQHISQTSNTALSIATGDYVGLLDHDDLLYPNALGEMVRFINYYDQPEILYSDERVVNKDGDPEHSPFFKPDYLPQLHLAVNYTTHFTLYKKSLVDSVGGFRKGYEGSQDHDLMLRAVEKAKTPVVHVPMVLYQWRAHEQSTASDISTKHYAIDNGVKAVKDALQRRGRKATVTFNKKTLHYDIDYDLIDPDILVSIIIPNKNNNTLLENCLKSIQSKSGRINYEVIVVDNQSTDEDLFSFYDEVAKDNHTVKVIKYDKPFNFGAINNFAVDRANGEFVLFLNNDTKILSDNWLEKLVQLAQFPEIGAVGAKLLYPNDLIQHAGINLMDRKIAGHSWINHLKDANHYMDFLNTIHEVTAVTAACLCIEKNKFFRAGRFDEKWVPNGWGDVDFGLKLREKGLDNIFTPHVLVRHHESPSRGISLEYFEKYHLIEKFGGPLMKDRFLHPFLMRTTNFDLDPEYLTYDLNNMTLSFFLENENPDDWNLKNYERFEHDETSKC